MKRKLFFLIEKLEINRSERIAVSALFAFLILLSGVNALYQPAVKTDAAYYAELEEVFLERSRITEQEHRQIMARYEPNSQAELPAATPDVAESSADTVIVRGESGQDETVHGDKMNINTASVEELQELPGIGPAYAQRIIDWREENGNFTSKEQLLEIRGIGERRLETIKPLITL